MREILFFDFLQMTMQISQNGLLKYKMYRIVIKIKYLLILQKLMLVIRCLLLKLLVFWVNQFLIIHRVVMRAMIRMVLQKKTKERGHLNVEIQVG